MHKSSWRISSLALLTLAAPAAAKPFEGVGVALGPNRIHMSGALRGEDTSLGFSVRGLKKARDLKWLAFGVETSFLTSGFGNETDASPLAARDEQLKVGGYAIRFPIGLALFDSVFLGPVFELAKLDVSTEDGELKTTISPTGIGGAVRVYIGEHFFANAEYVDYARSDSAVAGTRFSLDVNRAALELGYAWDVEKGS